MALSQTNFCNKRPALSSEIVPYEYVQWSAAIVLMIVASLSDSLCNARQEVKE